MKIESAIDLYPDLAKAQKNEDKKFRNAAKLYEKQFIRDMVKAMRSTVKPSGLVKQNFAEKIYREKLDEEYVQGWSTRGGVGLSEIIYDQLKERFSSYSKGPIQAPQGPLPIKQQPIDIDPSNEKKDIILLDSPQLPESSQFLFQGHPGGNQVTSPWSGKVSQVFALDGERQVVQIEHDNGLRSKLVFEGSPEAQLKGKTLSAGESLGRAFGESSTLSWKVTKSA